MLKDKLYSVKEAATLKGFTCSYIRRLIMTRKLKAQKVGYSWLITQKDLSLLVRKRQKEA